MKYLPYLLFIRQLTIITTTHDCTMNDVLIQRLYCIIVITIIGGGKDAKYFVL